jgi:hypothetical protein
VVRQVTPVFKVASASSAPNGQFSYFLCFVTVAALQIVPCYALSWWLAMCCCGGLIRRDQVCVLAAGGGSEQNSSKYDRHATVSSCRKEWKDSQ